jgi:hypothetical protein
MPRASIQWPKGAPSVTDQLSGESTLTQQFGPELFLASDGDPILTRKP